MFRLIDTHAHLEEIGALKKVIEEARLSGVIAIIAVGSDYKSNQQVLQIAEEHEGFVYPALGLHPSRIEKAELDRTLEFIEAKIDRAVCIGEIGLDYHKKIRTLADKDLQQSVFRETLGIAVKYHKPVSVHSRYAWRDAFTLVTEAGIEEAVFHWYTGTSSVLREIIDRGYFLSATPAVEYHEEHRRVIKETPLEQLLLETDSPVVYGQGRESAFESRPADIYRSLRGVAVKKGMDETEVAEITTANAERLFRLRIYTE
ncbi:MAG: TatD family hydrolase [Dehalococcoidales bacterium]|nr:TatD family hydrolase [Dehalococcoidales bacterium]